MSRKHFSCLQREYLEPGSIHSRPIWLDLFLEGVVHISRVFVAGWWYCHILLVDIDPVKAVFPSQLCSLWRVQMVGWITTLRSYSLNGIWHHLFYHIISLCESIGDVCQVYEVENVFKLHVCNIPSGAVLVAYPTHGCMLSAVRFAPDVWEYFTSYYHHNDMTH